MKSYRGRARVCAQAEARELSAVEILSRRWRSLIGGHARTIAARAEEEWGGGAAGGARGCG